jgi:hypothetical protein
MSQRRLPDDLEPVAARLRANRAQADPLQLDRIKRNVMARSSGERQGWSFMKSRVATVSTLVALLGGAGGAIAVGETGASGGPQGGAASGQYCGHKQCPPPPRCNQHGNHKAKCHKNKHPDARKAGKYARHKAAKAAKPHARQGKGAYNHTFNQTYNPAYNQAFNKAWLKQHHKS